MIKNLFLILFLGFHISIFAADGDKITISNVNYTVTSELNKEVSIDYVGWSSDASTAIDGNFIIPDVIDYNGTKYVVTSIGDEFSIYGYEELTFGKYIERIGNSFLYSISSRDLEKINFNQSLTTIGDRAFAYYVGKIKEIKLPNSVTHIGNYFGYGATSINYVELGENLSEIGDYSFNWCSELEEINIPKSLIAIGNNVFTQCESLKEFSVDIENKTYSSKDGILFDKNKNVLLVFPSASTISQYTIPSTVEKIGNLAFFKANNLRDVEIPNSVKEIGSGNFYACDNISSLKIPASLTKIGDQSFTSSKALKSINVDSNNPSYSSNDGVLFNKSQTTLITYPSGKATSHYNVPNTVSEIGLFGFSGSKYLEEVNLESVKIINLGAFNDCAALKTISIPSTISKLNGGTFFRCKQLSSVSLPASLSSIGEQDFYDCPSLEEITLPNSIIEIGNNAFSYCTGLKSISIPSSISKLSYGIFEGCSSLRTITLPSSLTKIEEYAFDRCSSIEEITLPHSILEIGNNAFSLCTSLKRIVFPNKITRIPSNICSECKSLEQITFGESVKEIEDFAFYLCQAVNTIYSLPVIPPSISISDISCFSKDSEIYVPKESEKKYVVDSSWSYFWNYHELGENAVEEIMNDPSHSQNRTHYFNLQGFEIQPSELSSGHIYIKVSNGKSKKIIIE